MKCPTSDQDGGFTNALESADKWHRGPVKFPASLYITAAGYLYCFTQGTTRRPGPELTYRIRKFIQAASS